jgi:hypothetical protein
MKALVCLIFLCAPVLGQTDQPWRMPGTQKVNQPQPKPAEVKAQPSTQNAHADGPMPDRWRGLVLDQSTPEDAIRILGAPEKDKPSGVAVFRIKNWLSKQAREKVFRTLEFKKPAGIDKASLSFLDGKLVAISLDVKKGISPNGLANIYGVDFQPAVGALDIAFNPRDYERNQGRVYPKTYPTVYSLVAASEKSFIDAMVSNVPSFGGAFARTMGVPDQPGSFPGRVEFITLVSRRLENRDGADVLK